MKDASDSNGVRAYWITMAIGVASLVGIGLGGCLELNTNHCLTRGGDLACGADEVCVLALRSGRSPGDYGDGCATEVPANFLRLPYGLPATRGMEVDSGVDTLAGALSPIIGGSCALDEVLTDVEDEWEAIAQIRDKLGKRPRVLVSEADLTQSEVNEIASFVFAVDGWVDDCREQTTGQTETGGVDSDGTD